MVFQKPLETFADILQLSSNILHGNGQINNSCHTGEESGGTAEQRISGMISYIFLTIVGFILIY